MSAKNRCLFVIDFNGVLLKRAKDHTERKIAKSLSHNPSFKNKKEEIYLRPHLNELNNFFELNKWFCDYAFWTSAMEVNAKALYGYVTNDGLLAKPKFLWSQNECEEIGDIDSKPLFLKDLSQVWNVYESEYKKQNVILIDDDAYKSAHNENFIHISKYNVNNEECVKGDETLKKLVDFLEVMKTSLQDKKYNDCVSFMKENVFKS